MACKINKNETCNGRCCRNCAQVTTCGDACKYSDTIPGNTDCQCEK